MTVPFILRQVGLPLYVGELHKHDVWSGFVPHVRCCLFVLSAVIGIIFRPVVILESASRNFCAVDSWLLQSPLNSWSALMRMITLQSDCRFLAARVRQLPKSHPMLRVHHSGTYI